MRSRHWPVVIGLIGPMAGLLALDAGAACPPAGVFPRPPGCGTFD